MTEQFLFLRVIIKKTNFCYYCAVNIFTGDLRENAEYWLGG